MIFQDYRVVGVDYLRHGVNRNHPSILQLTARPSLFFVAVADIKMIEGAIRHWQEQTCIRFRRADASEEVEQQHLLFTSGGG